MAATSSTRYDTSKQGLIIPGVDGSRPQDWMVPAGDSNPMHFHVKGVDDVLLQPAWEVCVYACVCVCVCMHVSVHACVCVCVCVCE